MLHISHDGFRRNGMQLIAAKRFAQRLEIAAPDVER
jgi:hypothetical protein